MRTLRFASLLASCISSVLLDASCGLFPRLYTPRNETPVAKDTYSPFFASVADGLKNRRTDPGVGQSAGTRSA